MKKALFVSPAGAVYGSERSMLGLLGARNFEAEVVCPPGGALEVELEKLEIKVYPLSFGAYSFRQNPLWHIRFFKIFYNILRLSQPDVLVINLDGNTPLVTLAAFFLRVPIIRYSRFEFSHPKRLIDCWCWRRVSAIICPSDLVKQQVCSWCRLNNPTQVYRLYDAYTGSAVSDEETKSFRQEFEIDESKILGYVGRLHRGKRLETTIEALAILHEYGKHIKLMIIGGDDGSPEAKDYIAELLVLAERLSVKSHVIFAGYLDHKKTSVAFSAMDAFILPSESESFGMVLMEAWAHGIPTVASNVGGCKEITLASTGGLLANVGDAKNFAELILWILSNPDEAHLMGIRGKEWVNANCTPEQYLLKFENILTQFT